MSDSNENNCLLCDYGDIEIMRASGYYDENLVFCEKRGKVIEVIPRCEFYTATRLEEKKEARMSFLIQRMAERLNEMEEK